ncbi:MAG: hypothetical protein HYX68_22430 [Planctomycetes bacterium]|jgi:hypothetical protein|nr:hypothetical protein [Planctomycetota bacterium]
MNPARMLIFCSFAFACMFVAGCQKRSTTLNQVTGKVFYKGAPLSGGLIVFSPDVNRGETGTIAFSKIGPDGSYTLQTADAKGATAGWYRVTVASLSSTSGSYETPVTSLIPDKYRDPSLSQLQCEVKTNRDNHLDFNLD